MLSADCSGLLRFSRRQSRLGLLGEALEAGGIVDRQVRQNFAVEIHAALLEPVDELAVAQAVELGGGADAHDPQRAILPLFQPPSGVGKLQPALHRFLGGAVELGFSEEITAGTFEYLFALGAAFGAAFNTRHGVLLF